MREVFDWAVGIIIAALIILAIGTAFVDAAEIPHRFDEYNTTEIASVQENNGYKLYNLAEPMCYTTEELSKRPAGNFVMAGQAGPYTIVAEVVDNKPIYREAWSWNPHCLHAFSYRMDEAVENNNKE